MVKRVLATIIVVGGVIGFAQSAHAWWNSDWPYRKSVTAAPSAAVPLTTSLNEQVVLLRLHAGNFNFFADVRNDGGDLRFIANDDVTPLAYHIERYDAALGQALIWVRISELNADTAFWMYYGNPEAESGSDPSVTFSADTALVLHFNDPDGTPSDATDFSHPVRLFNGSVDQNSVIGQGIQLTVDATLAMESSSALDLGRPGGATFGGWLRIDENLAADDTNVVTRVLTQQGDNASLTVDLVDGVFTLAIERDSERVSAIADAVLTMGLWHHLAIVVAQQTVLYLDGEAIATLNATPPSLSGPLQLGAVGVGGDELGTATVGFNGGADEWRFLTRSASINEVVLAAGSQAPDGVILALGDDETRDRAGALKEYFALFVSMFTAVRPEGWAILLLLALIGIMVVDVIIEKSFSLSRIERADRNFLEAYGALDLADHGAVVRLANEPNKRSTIATVFRAGVRELDDGSAIRDSAGLDAMRAEIEATLVELTEHLNKKVVYLTIAVSGGPFLGLLGTVLGVMVTFATIAASGDVNVNTIAPGVSAALTTTVMGLAVAIPALFGYNVLAGRITRRITALETFAERFISHVARAGKSLQSGAPDEATRAA